MSPETYNSPRQTLNLEYSALFPLLPADLFLIFCGPEICQQTYWC